MRRPRAKTLRLAAVTAASAAVTAACGISNAATTGGLAAGPSSTPITIGISEPLSGPAQAQGFAADGQACLQGYELWASVVNSHGGLNGHPVKLIVMNDEGWTASTKYDYRWLITHDHVDLTLAPFSSLLTATAAGPVTKQYGYALAAGQAGGDSVYALNDRDLFSTNVPVKIQMVPFANWVASLPANIRPKTAAYPAVNNPFSDPPVVKTMLALQQAGIRTVYRAPGSIAQDGANYGYTKSTPGVLKAAANAVIAKHPDLVVLGSVDVPTVQAFIKQFIARGFQPKMLIAAAGPDQGNQFLGAIGTGNSYGVMVPNGWFGGYSNALSHVMVQNYIAKYGGTSSVINADVAESYSAAQVLQAAVEATHGTVQSKLISWLHQKNNTIQTVLGPATFGPNGENNAALGSATIFQWQPGSGGTGAKFVQVIQNHNVSPTIIKIKPNWTG